MLSINAMCDTYILRFWRLYRIARQIINSAGFNAQKCQFSCLL